MLALPTGLRAADDFAAMQQSVTNIFKSARANDGLAFSKVFRRRNRPR